MNRKKLLLMPGDGIGPEVVLEARKVIDWFVRDAGLPIDLDEDLVGAASINVHGTPLTERAFEKARESDAILFGCIGDPHLDFLEERTERPGFGLLRLRKGLELFGNLRPVKAFPSLHAASTLKQDVIEGVDLLIVRELNGGLYFGEPRGIEQLADGRRRGFNTLTYDSTEVRRVARTAFELARKRSNRLCSVDKANALETSELWREEVIRLHESEFADVQLTHMYVDNCAMQLVRNPRQFDVIVTDNLFGDILSDCAAMITGSLGLLPSASVGIPSAVSNCSGLYEPVHGSAPDIAGQGIANPYGTLLSLEMLLRLSFGMTDSADQLLQAVSDCLARGVRTRDLCRPGESASSTAQIGDAVVACLADMSKSKKKPIH